MTVYLYSIYTWHTQGQVLGIGLLFALFLLFVFIPSWVTCRDWVLLPLNNSIAEAAYVGSAENVLELNVSIDKEVSDIGGRFSKSFENHVYLSALSWAKSIFKSLDGPSGVIGFVSLRLLIGNDITDFFDDSVCAAVIRGGDSEIIPSQKGLYVWPELLRYWSRSPIYEGSFQILNSNFVVSDLQPSNDDKAPGEEHQGQVSHFQVFANDRRFKPIAVELTGNILLFIGIGVLFRSVKKNDSILDLIGFVLGPIGLVISVFGPFLYIYR